jgi:tRNA(fMet)-specific endonuclease VapC
MKYILDTNICIGLIRRKPKELIERLVACLPGDVSVSSITVAELAHGAQKSNLATQNLSALSEFLIPLNVKDFDQSAAIIYGEIRAALEKQGNIIGSMDMFIASHALSLDVTLVTNNIREFQRVANLKLEDWMA